MRYDGTKSQWSRLRHSREGGCTGISLLKKRLHRVVAKKISRFEQKEKTFSFKVEAKFLLNEHPFIRTGVNSFRKIHDAFTFRLKVANILSNTRPAPHQGNTLLIQRARTERARRDLSYTTSFDSGYHKKTLRYSTGNAYTQVLSPTIAIG